MIDYFYKKMLDLKFYYVRGHERIQPTEEFIVALERQVSYALPPSYREFLANYGRSAFNMYVWFPLERYPYDDEGLLAVFLGFSSDNKTYDIRASLETYRGRMPDHFLPIATDPTGNVICLSLFGKDSGKVYFWDHERNELSQEKWQRMLNDLNKAKISTQNLSIDEIIMMWEQGNPDNLNHPPSYSNVYHIANSFADFFEILQAEEE